MPEVINLILCSTKHEISIAKKIQFQILKTFHASKLSYVVFILLIYDKMPTKCRWHFNIYEQDKFHQAMQNMLKGTITPT